MVKIVLATLLGPLAHLVQRFGAAAMALWSFARLKAALPGPLHRSNVVLGPVTVEGTGHIAIGQGARIYPGVLLETQGAGEIVIGDHVVLSRGVHIVAFDKVVLGDGCMVGEYASLRDANHNKSRTSMRLSGHSAASIELGENVWIGRGAVVLKGVHIGKHCIVGANAVVTHSLSQDSCAVGVPAQARPLAYTV